MKLAHPALGPTVIYRLKITVDAVEPAVWRRVLVPSTATLADLHDIIQGIFDWDDSHLHVFRVNNREYMHPDTLRNIDDFPRPANAEKVLLAGIFARGIKKFEYEYDFGDSWHHTIKFEKQTDPEPSRKYPEVIDGENAGPLEDSGGYPGYNDLVEIWKSRDSAAVEDFRLEWAGPHFNPGYFDLKKCNQRLTKYHKPKVVIRAKPVKKAAKDSKRPAS